MNNCSYYNICIDIRSKAQSGESNESACWNPGWLLNNKKNCEHYHPGLRPKSSKKVEVKIKPTQEDFRKQAKHQVAKELTVPEIIKRCLEEGNKDTAKILERLAETFPDIKENKLRNRIRPTVKYLEAKGIVLKE